MSGPILAVFNLGGGEIILLLAILLFLGLGAAALIVFLSISIFHKGRTAAPPGPEPQPPDIEQQLRMLAKLKEDGVITQEDFDAKKKALLGL